MIALKLTDEGNNVLELQMADHYEHTDQKTALLTIQGEDFGSGGDSQIGFTFENKSELNSFITWLVGIKKHLPD